MSQRNVSSGNLKVKLGYVTYHLDGLESSRTPLNGEESRPWPATLFQPSRTSNVQHAVNENKAIVLLVSLAAPEIL